MKAKVPEQKGVAPHHPVSKANHIPYQAPQIREADAEDESQVPNDVPEMFLDESQVPTSPHLMVIIQRYNNLLNSVILRVS